MVDNTKMNFLFSCGGTGGHIYPALAIAKELKERYPQARFLFVGATGRMEMQRVPQEGFPIVGLPISGFQGKGLLHKLLFPFKVLRSLYKARQILKDFRPDAVIGTGGYASAPTLKVAQWMGYPVFVQEQNSYAGMANKWVARGAQKVFVAYPHMERYFPHTPLLLTGNPVRKDLITLEPPTADLYQAWGLAPDKFTLLVLGGSLGARRINELIAAHLPFLRERGIQLLWQCGQYYYEDYKHLAGEGVVIRPYIDQMSDAYRLASVILSRAGASSVSELALVGKPVIFVPSPNVAEDHQTKNAQAIASQGAAILLPEAQGNERFASLLSQLQDDAQLREELAQHFKALARPQATQQIADAVIATLAPAP